MHPFYLFFNIYLNYHFFPGYWIDKYGSAEGWWTSSVHSIHYLEQVAGRVRGMCLPIIFLRWSIEPYVYGWYLIFYTRCALGFWEKLFV